MECKVVRLTPEHLAKLMGEQFGAMAMSLQQAYLSPGSVGYCLLADGEPVFAGGVVNMQWHRGEAWMLPTPWFREHIKTCFRYMQSMIPAAAWSGGFKRIQATCSVVKEDALAEIRSTRLFKHLEFSYEGTMKHFGPSGETCQMYARIFK